MKKIPTVFVRDFVNDPSRVLNQVHPDCEWVADGEGTATRKYDGTCCMYDGALWWKRREVKPGAAVPDGFNLVSTDTVTGKSMGWMPIDEGDKWHLDAISRASDPDPGSYELIGPKVQGNPEGFQEHVMQPHAEAESFPDCPRNYDGLEAFLKDFQGEGVVFHHQDGRMAKIKRRDFGWR